MIPFSVLTINKRFRLWATSNNIHNFHTFDT